MSLRRAILPLFAGLVLATVVPADARAQGGHSAGTIEYLARYLVTADDVALIARDGRLDFDRRFSLAARLLLDEGEPDPFQAAVATVALGSAGMTEEFERLRAAATSEDPLLRRAGVVALGELGPVAGQALLSLIDDPELGKLARLCLLRSGSPEGRVELLRRFAEEGAAEVPGLIEFVDRPTNFVECPAEARTAPPAASAWWTARPGACT